MTRASTERQAPEAQTVRDNRSRAVALRRLRDHRSRLTDQINVLIREEVATRLALRDRFGLTIPWDPEGMLYDILARVEPQDDGGWKWLGGTNNKALPTVKFGKHERSVTRYLAVAFGVIPEDFEGILQASRQNRECGYTDVNPWNRTVGPFPPGKRRGNPNRFREGSAT